MYITQVSRIVYLILLKFGSCGSSELHGFARNRMWTIDDNPPPLPANDFAGKSFVDLLLKLSEEDMKCWPHRYEFGCHEQLFMIRFVH